jgi:hypothetical protein
MMAQGERRAKALLAAAMDLFENWGSPTAGDAFQQAAEKYKEVRDAKLPEDPMVFTCPHCGAERPSYGWHFNMGDTGPFALQWLTCFCGECKNILSVAVPAFLPKTEMLEALKAQFARKITPA